MQIIKIKSNLSFENLLEKAKEREPQFKALPGLIQKYYIQLEEGLYGGVYIWDSVDSLAAYKTSDLAASIPQAYEATEKPSVQIAQILFQLRD